MARYGRAAGALMLCTLLACGSSASLGAEDGDGSGSGDTTAGAETSGGDSAGGATETGCDGWCEDGGLDLPEAETEGCDLGIPTVETLWERWDEHPGEDGNLIGHALALTDDGGLLVAGTIGYWYPENTRVMRYATDGTRIWEQSYDVEVDGAVRMVRPAEGMVAVGRTGNQTGRRAAAVVVLDDDGVMQWEWSADPQTAYAFLNDVAPGEAEGVVVAGTSEGEPWIRHLDASGTETWKVTPADQVTRLAAVPDGRLLTISAGALMTRDATGAESWSFSPADPEPPAVYLSVVLGLPDNGALVGGSDQAANGSGRVMARVDDSGSETWAWTEAQAWTGELFTDPMGFALMLGSMEGCFGRPSLLWTLGADGTPGEAVVLDAPVRALVVDENGRVFATGQKGDWGIGLWTAELARPDAGG